MDPVPALNLIRQRADLDTIPECVATCSSNSGAALSLIQKPQQHQNEGQRAEVDQPRARHQARQQTRQSDQWQAQQLPRDLLPEKTSTERRKEAQHTAQ